MNFFKAGTFTLPLNRTYVMGILNVTPDSFSDGNKFFTIERALEHAINMQNSGADIIDIGGQSTRPGYTKISPEEELKRVLPVLCAVRKNIKIPISIDTFYPEVAQECLKFGADIINDVNGFKNEEMFKVASGSNCGCIIMHDGNNNSMMDFFYKQVKKAYKYNIVKERICLDVGIGFGKSYEENLEAIKNLNQYKLEGFPMLLGASRKRVIGFSCGNPEFIKRLPGTIAAHTIGILKGADIIRVHDVSEAVQAAKVVDAIKNCEEIYHG